MSISELNARLYRAADSQVIWKVKHTGPIAPGHLGRSIQGTIVDHQNVGKGHNSLNATDHMGDVLLLVIRRDDHQNRSIPVWITGLTSLNRQGHLNMPDWSCSVLNRDHRITLDQPACSQS